MVERLQKRTIIVVLALLAGMLVAGTPIKADAVRVSEMQHGMGCVLSPPGDYLTLEVPVRAQGLPSVVDLSGGLPPVADQGLDPTCTLWAVGYYYKTFQEQRETLWGVDTTDHQFSPSFLYSLSGSCRLFQGVPIPTAMELVKNEGCAPLATFSLLSFGQCRMPTAGELDEARPFRAESYGNLFMHPGNANVYQLKAHLASGDPFVLSVPVYDSFYYYRGQESAIGVPGGDERLWGHHAILVVGYDGSRGAFKFVNSWGTRWGDSGYGYLSYDFVRVKAWEAWAMVDAVTPTTTPTVTPSAPPTPEPTVEPTTEPTAEPTVEPTVEPTAEPTTEPTPSPTPGKDTSTLVLQQGLDGYQGVTDTHIDSAHRKTNFHWSQTLKVNGSASVVSLLRFDLSAVPSGAEIVEATVELSVELDALGQDFCLTFSEVLSPWLNTEVDWRRSRKEHPWGIAGCKDTDRDHASIPAGAQVIQQGDGWQTMDVTSAVRRWVSGQSDNNGLLLQGQGAEGAMCSFTSSNYWSTGMRPMLVISYR